MSISSIWNSITEFIENVKNTITDVYDIFISMINFFPSPFKEILLGVISIILIVIIYRIVRK